MAEHCTTVHADRVANLRRLRIVLPASYLALYSASWIFVWWVHRSGHGGDGLVFFWTVMLTLPVSFINVDSFWPLYVGAAVNALAIYGVCAAIGRWRHQGAHHDEVSTSRSG